MAGALEILVFGVEGFRIQNLSGSLLNAIEIKSLIQKSELFSRWMNLGSLSLYFFPIVLCLCKKGAPLNNCFFWYFHRLTPTHINGASVTQWQCWDNVVSKSLEQVTVYGLKTEKYSVSFSCIILKLPLLAGGTRTHFFLPRLKSGF